MRLPAALVLGALLFGSPASAQTPVEGGGDFAQAPLVPPGSYEDSIRLRETLFYAVTLGAGQRVRARAAVSNVSGNPLDALVSIDLVVYNPRREEAGRDGTVMTGPAPKVRLSVGSEVVGAEDPRYEQAGTYFLAVSMTPFRGEFQDVEYALDLRIDVTGEEVPVPGPTATSSVSIPSPPATTTGGTAPHAAAPGWTRAELAMFGLIGLLAGAFLGALGAARVRRL